ncbi:unnamed protein product, partial [Adineta steineri]
NSRIRIQITDFPSGKNTLGSVVEYYDVNNINMNLIPRYRQVFHGMPSGFGFDHNLTQVPILAVLRLYNLTNFHYYILYIQPNKTTINITSTPQECPHSISLVSQNDIPAAFQYHRICRNESLPVCFYDSTYLCICESDRKQAACFIHDLSLELCNLCVSGGKCIQEDRRESKDSICLCPRCYSGRLCEFNMQVFTFVLDSLLAFDKASIQCVYITIVSILFIIGLFNNLCSFVTFKRPRLRIYSVSRCLLMMTILNQCALFFLLIKFLQILFGSTFHWSNNLSCKVVNYFLAVCTRSSYWLTSWITIVRLLMVIYPMMKITKNAATAIWSSVIVVLTLLILHIHEIIFSKSIDEPDSRVALCVIDFAGQSIITNYNRISTLLHYVIPFLVQVISVTLLIVFTTRRRAKALGSKIKLIELLKKQFKTQKELYVMPCIIVLSVLPEAIISFGLACKQLHDWQRHTLLAAYLLSYAPQLLGFLLFVLPSSTYKREFSETFMAKTFFKRFFTQAREKYTIH